jgi:hypothetical protein
MSQKSNSAELITLIRAKISRIETASAKGIDRTAAFEIAELSGMALRLHYQAEEELIATAQADEHRARQVRIEAAGRLL